MIARAVAMLLALSLPAAAQDFSHGSEAKRWNLYAEVPARFEAKVVDLLCEVQATARRIAAMGGVGLACYAVPTTCLSTR